MDATFTRQTRQRTAILTLLEEAGTFLSAQELFDELRARGSKVGLTTVYRNLQILNAVGEIDVLRREDGESIYRRCEADEHHHHLICRQCGFAVELANDQLETWTRSLAQQHRFTDVTHDLELFGVCNDCSVTV